MSRRSGRNRERSARVSTHSGPCERAPKGERHRSGRGRERSARVSTHSGPCERAPKGERHRSGPGVNTAPARSSEPPLRPEP
ncbi:hypothetical protein GCM10018980_22140 [Streptomyces capoamus]|uniref:Uncharacterized protein n=1 Tax=Streptomyces capoamus TaxID=68183 RepID=A0A919C2W5_9ACTN|nr:hypothetical protein GCM10018980_22140 [Streptomyces capoamus]